MLILRAQCLCKITQSFFPSLVSVGKLKHKKILYVGEHDLIVQPDVFQKVQTLLLRNRHSGSSKSRNRHGALLRRLLYCKACGRAMVHNFTGRGGKQYRYVF